VEAVRHIRTLNRDIKELSNLDEDEVFVFAKKIGASIELLEEVRRLGRLPVVNFAAGGVATPADAALCMQLGVDGVFVGSGIFKSEDPERRTQAIVQAVTHYKDAKKLAEVSTAIGAPMTGIGMGDGTNFAAREAGNMPAKVSSHGYASGYAKEPRSKHADWSPQGTSLVA
jgi:pyridoxal 5'-phosphate synthase pdxS subunit